MSALTLAIVLLAGFLQGTFGLGMRKSAPLAWEAYWLIFSVAGMIVIPAVWATATVLHPWGAVAAVPASLVLRVMVYGACWGVGAIMFGLAVNYVGMSLSNGIAMGLAAVMGSLVPMVQKGNLAFDRATLMILLGNLVMVIGVGIVTLAGIDRDRLQAARGKPIAGIQTGRLFWLGLFFCIASGVASAMLNIGTVAGAPIAKAAVQLGGDLAPEARQALERNASVVPWVVLFWGGAIVNLIYCAFLLIKNKSYQTYRTQGARQGHFLGRGHRRPLVLRPGPLWARRGADGKARRRGRLDHVHRFGAGGQQRLGHSHRRVERLASPLGHHVDRKRGADCFRHPAGLRQ